MKQGVFLGIDPGFSCTGYAILQKGSQGMVARDIGYLSLSTRYTLSERVGQFYDFFYEKITQYDVTHIALETSFLGKNAQSFLKLGYLRGILYLLAQQRSCTLHEFPPKTVKAAVTGFGGASKEQVARAIERFFPKLLSMKAVARHDVTDALAICMCGIWQAGTNVLMRR